MATLLSSGAPDAPLPTELVRFRAFASPSVAGADEPEVYDHLRGRLRFKDITTFNDPFEGRPFHVAAYDNPGKQREAMLRYLAAIPPNISGKAARRRLAEELIAGKGQQEIIDLVSAYIESKDKSGEVFVLCLMDPQVVSTPLPWSHYADAHRGVCLHFDSSKLPIHLAFQIEYSDEYPITKVPRTAQTDWEGLRSELLRKAAVWRYEREFRVFRLKYEAGFSNTLNVPWDGDIAIAPSNICVAITFGCRMDKDPRERLTAWIRQNTPHVEVWQAKRHRSRYELVRERVA